MTNFICMECFKSFDEKLMKWFKPSAAEKTRVVGALYDKHDTQVCAKCYGKHIIYDLLRKELKPDERKKLDLELMEDMELVTGE